MVMQEQEASLSGRVARRRRERFRAISAVEGIRLTPAMDEMLAMFDREGWAADRRRAQVMRLFERAPVDG
jgi:hypothetical protein